MEDVVDDVFDDLLEQDEVFDEELVAVETVFCVLDGGSVGPDQWKSHIYMIMSMVVQLCKWLFMFIRGKYRQLNKMFKIVIWS